MADHFHGFNQVIVMISLSPIVGLVCWIVLSHLHARSETAISQGLLQV